MKLIRMTALAVAAALLLSSAVFAQDTTGGAAPGRELRIGETVQGNLTPDSPSAIFNFIGQAGTVVTITMESSDVDSYLRLGDQRGNPLLADDDSARDLDARIGPVSLPEDGAYVIVATSFSFAVSDGTDLETGSFRLTLTQYEPEEISYPVEIEDALAVGQPLAVFSFEAAMGDVLQISLDSNDFDPLLILTEADNISAASVRDDDSGPGLNALITPYIVPADGTYLLTALSFRSDNGGDFVLAVTRLEAQTIELDDVVEISLTPDELAVGVFSFDAAEGDTVDIIVDSPTDLDTTLTLLGPDGAQLAYNDDTTGRNPALLGQSLPETGTYTFIVQPFRRGNRGDIVVQVTQSNDS